MVLALLVELNRRSLLLDIHRSARPATMHLTGSQLLFRLILSEQTDRAPRMFLGLGVASAQMVTLSGGDRASGSRRRRRRGNCWTMA